MVTVSVRVNTEISLKKVLFAIDFSASSLAAFPFAASVARHYGGQVVLAHVATASERSSANADVRAMLDKMLIAAEEGLLASQGGSEAPHQVMTDYGEICPTLLSVADKCEVDLIVIGTHGLSGIKKLLKGSTAEEIMCLSSKPLLIVGPHVTRTTEFHRILYGTNFSPEALGALAYADSLKHAYKASLVLLHVNDGSTEERPTEATPKTLDFLEHARSHGYAEIGGRCEAMVEFGPKAERILEVAGAQDTDLIVLGLHAHKGIKARIRAHLPGSVAYDVISQAHCPVLTVPLLPAP
jgi:nucleotide-binding universal stress UspA family protein